MSLNVVEISKAVQHNCHISDAQYAAEYPLCIYLLKMREYYRWEQKIPLGAALDQQALGSWLVQREAYWDEIAHENLGDIVIDEQRFDVFDNEGINQCLKDQALVYSGGMGIRSKPHFFFGKLRQLRQFDNLNIYIADDEFARELTAPPAMSLGSQIYIRYQSLRRMVWEKMEEWMWHKNDSPMGRLIAGLQGDLVSNLDDIAEHQLEMLIQHEIGEARVSSLLGDQWPAMILALPTKLELSARAVRDNLADCYCTLPYLHQANNAQQFHFYMANVSALRKQMFPQLGFAYEQWFQHADADVFQPVINNGKVFWLSFAQELLSIYEDQGLAWQEEFSRRLEDV